MDREMKIKAFALLALAPLSGFAADFVLTDAEQIKDASSIQKSVDAIFAKVAQCVDRKLAEPSRCFCLYPVELEDFKKVFATVIKNHPEWKDKIVYFEGRTEGHTKGHNLGFVGLQRMSEMKCEK